ncbi:hypothetical protein EDC94DRAFT_586954 [Helicostylum pulchrum]|nr:hypothetical protein EDC94DRAFT_586954 [Helicostylum pulchrum]
MYRLFRLKIYYSQLFCIIWAIILEVNLKAKKFAFLKQTGVTKSPVRLTKKEFVWIINWVSFNSSNCIIDVPKVRLLKHKSGGNGLLNWKIFPAASISTNSDCEKASFQTGSFVSKMK